MDHGRVQLAIILLGWHMSQSNWLYHFIGMACVTIQLAVSFYWDGTFHNPTGCIILLGWHVSQSNWLYHFIGMARVTIQLAVLFYWDDTCHNPTGCIILLGWHVLQSNWLFPTLLLWCHNPAGCALHFFITTCTTVTRQGKVRPQAVWNREV